MAAVFQPRREVMRKGQTTSRRGKCGKRAASPGVSDASSALACSDVGEEVTQNIVQYTAEEKNHNIAPESILNVHRQEKGKTVRPLAPSPIDAPRINAYGEVICWTFTWVTCVSQPIETLSTRPPVLQVWASVWGRKFRYLAVENSTTICYATDMLPSVSLQELS